MLADFIESNRDRFEFEVFGLTLFGGDLQRQPSFREQFLDAPDPRFLGYVVYENSATITECKDLTVPVSWALGLDLPP